MKVDENKRAQAFGRSAAAREMARLSKGDPRNPKKYDLDKVRAEMKKKRKKTQIVPGIGLITLEQEAPVKAEAPAIVEVKKEESRGGE